MQQAFYNTTGTPNTTQATRLTLITTAPARNSGLARWVACRWDMVGVLALMAAGVASSVFTLAHLGL